jgi:hypothetical protein
LSEKEKKKKVVAKPGNEECGTATYLGTTVGPTYEVVKVPN